MNDSISRQAALTALNEYFVRIGKLKRRGLNKGEKAISLDVVGAINSLPPAKPGWIPVTERLPDGEGRTIVTTKWDDGYTVSYSYYWGAVDKWGSITDNVIAWMPLPTPAKIEV